MIAWEDEGSRQAIWIGAFGLVLIHLLTITRMRVISVKFTGEVRAQGR